MDSSFTKVRQRQTKKFCGFLMHVYITQPWPIWIIGIESCIVLGPSRIPIFTKNPILHRILTSLFEDMEEVSDHFKVSHMVCANIF